MATPSYMLVGTAPKATAPNWPDDGRRTLPSRRATTTATPESVRGGGSYAMSEGTSPHGDASSEASGFTSASMLTEGPSSFPHLPAADFPLERCSSHLRFFAHLHISRETLTCDRDRQHSQG